MTDTPTPSRPRPRHLMDPSNPVPPPTNRNVSVGHVQMWVMSMLAVTTIAHFAAGLFIAGALYDHDRLDGRIAFNILGAFSSFGAVVAFRAIHKLPVVTWWLLLGFVPTVVGVWFTFGR